MAKEIDYSTYSAEMRVKVMQVVYAELGVSAKTGWVRFVNRGGKMGLHYADELGFWLAQDRHLTPLEAGAEDTGNSFRAWATLVDPKGGNASGEASVAKTNKRLHGMREELQKATLTEIEQLAVDGDWLSIELQRGLVVALHGEGEMAALTAALARILDGAQKPGEARDLVMELLSPDEEVGDKLDQARSREEFRNLASEYVARLNKLLTGKEREKTLRTFVLAVVKTTEDLNARALALDRAKARAAIDLCKGRIVRGIKRVEAKATPAESKPKPAEVEVVKLPVVTVQPKTEVAPSAPAKEVTKPAVIKPAAVVETVKAKPATAAEAVKAKAEVKVSEPEIVKPKTETKPEVVKPVEKPKSEPVKVVASKTAKPASAKQQAYVRDLMRKAGVKSENMALRMSKLLGESKKIEELSAVEAAIAIDKLLVVLKKKKSA